MAAGTEIEQDKIIKEIEYGDGRYVIVSPEEIEAVHPHTTQTIEIRMAEQLVGDMQGSWSPAESKDEFRQSIMNLVDRKVMAGNTESVVPPGEGAPAGEAEIIDLLVPSLKGSKATADMPVKGPSLHWKVLLEKRLQPRNRCVRACEISTTPARKAAAPAERAA